MLTGIRTHFHPDALMAEKLSQWIGCARVVYNAKCEEDTYLRAYAQRYLPVGTYTKPTQGYSQYKDPELTPWLSECPSQILRNSATIWYRSYQRFLKGVAGRPKRKNRVKGNYIWLTQELFEIKWEGCTCVLTIGTKRNPAGTVRVKWNKSRVPKEPPKSIWIKKTAWRWYLSFSYDDGHVDMDIDNEEHLEHLRNFSEDELAGMITPIDRGVVKPFHTDDAVYCLSRLERDKASERERRLRRYQRRMARQQKGSNRRKRTIASIVNLQTKTANVRNNFWHQTTRTIVDNAQVVVIEDLKLKNMTRRSKPKVCDITGKYLKNGACAKSGLNRSILGIALGASETMLKYKMRRAGKPFFKVSPHHTSQECACCGYTHPGNRATQSDFLCLKCGNRDNADHNAALVIRKRAIKLILHSGTELAGAHNNVLRPGTGVNLCKTKASNSRLRNGLPVKKDGGLTASGSPVL